MTSLNGAILEMAEYSLTRRPLGRTLTCHKQLKEGEQTERLQKPHFPHAKKKLQKSQMQEQRVCFTTDI